MAFVRNAWYVAAWSRDLGRTLMRRTILGEDVVLFRKENGEPAALRDLCPHRYLPLSLGKLKGDAIECGYHGMTFDGSGACVGLRVQDTIPPNARVQSYPISENLGLVWIWMGEPAEADPSEIFDLPQYHDPAWGVGHGDALFVKANYMLLTDNLTDPTHVSFVHPTTLGNPDHEEVPVNWDHTEDCVTTTRLTPSSEPIGFVKAFGNLTDKVDRWQIYHMHVPSIAIIDFGSAKEGTGVAEGSEAAAIKLFSCHFMTPETETTTFDYWVHVRNFAPDDTTVTDGISDQFRIAFAEDKIILEAIQTEEERHGTEGRVGLDLDGPAGLFRHLVGRRIRAEQSAQAAE
jgi:vanillate O-demethylase monooxygenase subunit